MVANTIKFGEKTKFKLADLFPKGVYKNLLNKTSISYLNGNLVIDLSEATMKRIWNKTQNKEAELKFPTQTFRLLAKPEIRNYSFPLILRSDYDDFPESNR